VSDTVTPRDALLEAARVLMEDRWCQGELHSPDGEHCVAGALGQAHYRLRSSFGALDTACTRMRVVIRSEYGTASFPRWNDAPERTAEDVILALKRAAEEAE
jgi:hypothetical protein